MQIKKMTELSDQLLHFTAQSGESLENMYGGLLLCAGVLTSVMIARTDPAKRAAARAGMLAFLKTTADGIERISDDDCFAVQQRYESTAFDVQHPPTNTTTH